LPNGDVIVAEAQSPTSNLGGGFTGWIASKLMARAGSGGPSPDRLVLLRDGDGDGAAEAALYLARGQAPRLTFGPRLGGMTGFTWAIMMR
jgi:hypothetical protein